MTGGNSNDQKEAARRAPSRWMRKTKMCVYNLQGKCTLGENCLFAHSPKELQDGPDLYKTQLCVAFAQGGCNNPDCTYAHGSQDLQPFPALKRKLCRWHKKGVCRNGNDCCFAHGVDDIRASAESNSDSSSDNEAGIRGISDRSQCKMQNPQAQQVSMVLDYLSQDPSHDLKRAAKYAQNAQSVEHHVQPVAHQALSLVDLLPKCSQQVSQCPQPRASYCSKRQQGSIVLHIPVVMSVNTFENRTPLCSHATPYVPSGWDAPSQRRGCGKQQVDSLCNEEMITDL